MRVSSYHRYKIILPAPFEESTLWKTEFTTDTPDYVEETELIDDPIPVFSCEVDEEY